MKRKEKITIRKEKKRLKIAVFFLFLLAVFLIISFLRNFDWQSVNFFPDDKFIRPLPSKLAEQELAEELNKTNIGVNSLSIINDDSLEASISGGISILLKKENIAQQVSSLQLMLARFKIEGRIPKKIDLRFQKPVVVF